jgi:hypothetical protein
MPRVSTEVIVYVLTALAAVVIVLTRLRLARDGGAGQFRVAGGVLLAHTVVGGLALVTWVAYLVAPEDSALGGEVVGILAIGLWWVVALIGMLILLRWLPSKGRHATEATEDTWSEGPGLSVLAHVGMVVGVLVFTFAYLTSAV